MTTTALASPKLDLPDDSIRATFEEIHAASMAGQTARLEGRGPVIDSTLDALIGADSPAHRTHDLLHAWARGWDFRAPKHRAEVPWMTEETTDPLAEETGRNLMPVVVLLALASVPTAAVIAAVSYLA